MKLFVLNEEVAALESTLTTLQGEPHVTGLVTLAWHLRQRDSQRAVALADQAHALLGPLDATKAECQMARARLHLVRAEVQMLSGDLDGAARLASSACELFDVLNDRVGLGDAYLLRFSIARYCGEREQADVHLGLASTQYRAAGDALRAAISDAHRLAYGAFQNPVATGAELEHAFPATEHQEPALTAWVAAAQANVAVLTDDPGNCLRRNLQSYYAALASGQIARALTSMNNAAESFALLGDLDSALEWDEQALTLARSSGWPFSIGVCLMQMGDDLRLLARPEEARACLQEALQQMATLAGSRNYELALSNLAQLELDVGDYQRALTATAQLERGAPGPQEPDLLIKAGRMGASALFRLGRAAEAYAKAQAARALAQAHGNAVGQIEILTVLAEMHAEHALAPQVGETTPDAVLRYLHQALALAATIQGYRVAPELLNQVAQAYANQGNFQRAFEHSQAAHEARNATRKENAKKRALAMLIRGEVERVQAETEIHRQRAATLAEANATLEVLGTIGREITANLNAAAVFEALHRHAHALLDATGFAVYVMDPAQQNLVTAFATESGQPLPTRSVALDHPTSNFARCARERSEVVIDLEQGSILPNLIPGTLATLSLLYAPLMLGERLLGVMTIQTTLAHAYGERERFIFRSLCAYGAIALDNATAYATAEASQRLADQALQELREAQALLMTQNSQLEQLAATDQLTGLYNRLRIDQTMEEERLRGVRYGTSFCVLLLDIDHFKVVNDTFGHLMGDQVLIAIARVLGSSIRRADVLGRWGGEEFMVVCRETAIDGALVLAEGLRLAIQELALARLNAQSASFGVAMHREGETCAETVARADAALYRAKQNGRNRVERGD